MRRDLITVRWDCDYCTNLITVVVEDVYRHRMPEGWGRVGHNDSDRDLYLYRDACQECLKHQARAGMNTIARKSVRGAT